MKKHYSVILLLIIISLFAEKVSLLDATNVAINFYRESIVSWKTNNLKGYYNAINVDNIKVKIDSLCIDGINYRYFFYFENGYVCVSPINNMKPILDQQNYKKIDMNSYLKKHSETLEAQVYLKNSKKIYNENVNKEPNIFVNLEWEKYKVDPKEFKFAQPNIAERISLHEATNAAINYYRGNLVPDQINSGILTDFQKATNLDSIKFEIDSLVIEDLMVSYYFNFFPIGCVKIHAKNAIEIYGYADRHAFITKVNKDSSIQSITIDQHKYNYDYQDYYDNPNERFIKEWERYKIDPNDFNPEITYKGKVSFQNVKNVAVNYYRQHTAPNQYKKGIISDYKEAIKLENIKYEVDSLVIENKTVSYYFNFKPKGTIKVNAVYSIEPVSMWSEEGNINVKQAYLHRNDPGVISLIQFDTSNRCYQKYNDFPTYEIMMKWNEYQVDPKDFKIEINNADVVPDEGRLDSNDKK